MFKKEAYIDKDLLFCYPLAESKRLQAHEYIAEYGVEAFLDASNLSYYVPNVFPLKQRQLDMLVKCSAEEALCQIEKWIQNAHIMWNNVSADATQNQHINTAKIGYIGRKYGTAFIMGDFDALPDDAFVFPLLEEEMFLALDVIENKGIAFFVEHCAELPSCDYLRETQEETITNMESLYRWYGAYWLLGQLNASAILAIKDIQDN